MIKAVVFDLDGTLIDSIGDITYSSNVALKEFGFKEQSEDFVRLNTGKGFRVLIKDMLPKDVSDDLIDTITKRYTEIYGKHYAVKTKPYEGIEKLLIDLNNLGIKICVNSNKKDEYTKVLMQKLFPKIKFEYVIGERLNIPNKPDPYTAHEMLKNMNLTLDEALYIGDSEVDMKTAKNAKLKSIGCLWGFRGQAILEKEGADYFAEKADDIRKIIIELNK